MWPRQQEKQLPDRLAQAMLRSQGEENERYGVLLRTLPCAEPSWDSTAICHTTGLQLDTPNQTPPPFDDQLPRQVDGCCLPLNLQQVAVWPAPLVAS